MTLPVRITRAAERDLVLAQLWYLEEAPNVVSDFENELVSCYSRMADRPAMYRRVAATVRVATLRRFPYSVYYRVLDGAIEVIAILHQARDPRVWRRRL